VRQQGYRFSLETFAGRNSPVNGQALHCVRLPTQLIQADSAAEHPGLVAQAKGAGSREQQAHSGSEGSRFRSKGGVRRWDCGGFEAGQQTSKRIKKSSNSRTLHGAAERTGRWP